MIKKYTKIFLILSLFMLCGCEKNVTLNITINSVANIVYEDTKIVDSDFETLINKINNKTFYDLGSIDVKGKSLKIDTTDYLYNLEVFDNFLVYNIDEKRYYTKIDDISKYFDELINKYTDVDFFKIDVISNYNIDESDYLIKLDDSNQYIVIKTLLNIYDFEVTNNNYVANTQNKISRIDNNKIICIETNNLNNINIRFKNPYNYEVNVTYDKEFITNAKN